MCEAIVYLVKGDTAEKIMEDVVTVVPEGDKLLLTDIFGEQKLVSGVVDQVDLMGHTIRLTPR